MRAGNDFTVARPPVNLIADFKVLHFSVLDLCQALNSFGLAFVIDEEDKRWEAPRQTP